MTHNISQISYLIGQFSRLISTFGQKPESVQCFKEQSEGLASLGQVQQADLEVVYKLLGIVNTNNVKWSITIPRLTKFIEAMNYMISCVSDTQRQKCLIQLMKADKIDNTVAELIDELYDNKLLGGGFNIDSLKSDKFGTFGVIGATNKQIKNNHKESDSVKNLANKLSREDIVNELANIKLKSSKGYKDKYESIIEVLCEAGFSDIILMMVMDATSDSPRFIHIKNYEACCSCDPRYFNVSIKELIGLDMSFPKSYKNSIIKSLQKGEFCIVEHIKSMGDYLGIQESTANWIRCNRKNLIDVIQIIIDANIKIVEIERK